MNIFRKAEEFGISKLSAVRMRTRYVLSKIDTYYDDGFYPFVAHKELTDCLDLFVKATRKPPANVNNLITEDMIQKAREFPIEQIMQFNGRNQALAFCHNDTRPSLHLNKKKNACFCNVCGKVFSSIDIYMYVNNCNFYTAVRSLIWKDKLES